MTLLLPFTSKLGEHLLKFLLFLENSIIYKKIEVNLVCVQSQINLILYIVHTFY